MKNTGLKIKIEIPENRRVIFARLSDLPTMLLAMGPNLSDDGRLMELTKGVGQLAQALFNPLGRMDRLERIAAYAAGWLVQMGERLPFGLVHQERERQRELLAANRITFDCAAESVDGRRKLRALVEELGEVAHAIDQIDAGNPSPGNLKVELVQLAAVAVAWMETPECGVGSAECGVREVAR
jgi:hypothetical protein